jgi:sialate O-acetylesterase
MLITYLIRSFTAVWILQTVGLATVTLPDVIGDHMVLQRDQPVPIWGHASRGEQVTVVFGTQTLTTTANPAGQWEVQLKPLAASFEPAELVITGENQITLRDILVGEVWLCAGQSNMQWTLAQSAGGEAAMAAANHPHLRLFNVSREVGLGRAEGNLATWQAGTPEQAADFSGVGYFFALELMEALEVPIGMLNSSYGGSQAEAWTPREYLLANEVLVPCVEREKIWAAERPQVQTDYDQAIADWKAATEQAKANGQPLPRGPRSPDALRDYRIAASIYQGMIEPLMPFAIQGVLWYQGESNEARAEQYQWLLPTMIQSWRDGWHDANLPFAIVQLPNFRATSEVPEDEAWSHLRDYQRLVAQEMNQVDLVVTIDLGEADDIHPTNKLDVGKRLSLWALAEVYGRDLVWSGPVFKRAKVKRGKILLTFSSVGEGLQRCQGESLQEFVVAGEDQQWHWAEARIVGKRTLEVRSDQVADPVAVRYAFNRNPVQPNLSNETCIPASPFRTDDWPDPTAGKR